MLNSIRTLAALATLGSLALITPTLQATILGLPTSGNSFATFDTFSAPDFSNATPNSSDAAVFSTTLSSAITSGSGFPAAQLLSGGDVIYSGGNRFNFTLNGTMTGSSDVLAVQLKFVSGAGPTPTNFTLDLAGVGAADSQIFLGTTSEGDTYNIYQWSWEGLALTASDSFSISVVGNYEHTAIDALRVSDIAAVPEPGTIALLTLTGAGTLLFLRRRRA